MKENIAVIQRFLDYLYGKNYQLGEWRDNNATFVPVYGVDVETLVVEMMNTKEN